MVDLYVPLSWVFTFRSVLSHKLSSDDGYSTKAKGQENGAGHF